MARSAGQAIVLVLAGLWPLGCMVREVPHDYRSAMVEDHDDWETIRSRHFLVHTDAGRGGVDTIIARFEDTYQALSSTFFAGAKVRDVEAMVFADSAEYDRIAGRGTAGRFIPGLGPTGSLLVVRYHENRAQLERVVAHELVHRFADAVHPRLPNWMDEGIAMFLETVEVRDDEILIGESPRGTSEHGFADAGGVSFRDLVNAPLDRLYGNEARFYYAAAWAVVHHLMVGDGGRDRDRFSALLHALEQTQRAGRSAELAFTQVYPELSAARLDAEVERLTRGLNRPGVEKLMVLPFRRPPAESITRRPARREIVDALTGGVAARRRLPAPEPPAPTAGARRYIAAEGELALPPRHAGVVYGQTLLHPRLAWEADLGVGWLGYTTATRARLDWEVGEGRSLFLLVGLGPVLAVKSQALGLDVEHFADEPEPDGWYYLLALEPRVGAEVHTPSRFIIRLSVGGYVPLAGNMSQLCSSTRLTTRSSCDPADGRSGGRAAQQPFLLTGRFGLAYAW